MSYLDYLEKRRGGSPSRESFPDKVCEGLACAGLLIAAVLIVFIG